MAQRNVELYIIKPKEATNLIANPSVETNTSGYAAVGGSTALARSATNGNQRRGVYGLEITPTSSALSGVYYTIALTSGTQYTLSADIKDVAGQTYSIYFANTSGTVQGTATTWTGDGYWKRKAVTWTAASSTNYRLYLTRSSVASVSKFYSDGWQLEAGTESTYLDGDAKGFNRTRADYWWNGTPHASTSTRSGKTRSGGTMLRLKDYCNIIGVIGLGMTALTNNTIASANGSFYQNTRTPDREFSIAVQFAGDGYSEVMANRAQVVAAVNPYNVPTNEPLVVRWQATDSSGAPKSDALHLTAVYKSGLESDTTSPFSQNEDKAVIQFNTVFLPALMADGNSGTVLGYQTSVSNFANIGYRDLDGQWKAMGTGANDNVEALVVGLDGYVYAGGTFTQMGGVANTSRIARWNGSAWAALGTGALDGAVLALEVGPDGAIYAAGTFTQMGGVANTARIAKWNGTAWSALGTGMNNTVNALQFGSDGSLYAGGVFTTAGGTACSKIAKWNGSAWSALGAGMTGGINVEVSSLAFGPDDQLYAGGQFASAGGVTVNNIAKWNGAAWSTLGTGTGASLDLVYALAFGPGGFLYAGGLFETAGGVTVNNIGKWDGTTWYSLNGGMIGAGGTSASGQVDDIVFSNDGLLYAGGTFTSAGGVSLPDRGAIWNGSNWAGLDVDVQDALGVFSTYAFDPAGRLYLGGTWAGTTAISATVTAPDVPGITHPIFAITGPGTLWQIKNYTTGEAIYFDNLTLLDGETITIDTRPGMISAKSNFRGNVLSYFLPGSAYNMALVSGTNNISAYLTGTTSANSNLTARWQPAYLSVDGAGR